MRLPSLQGLRQRAPEAIKARASHFEHAANVGGFRAVEEEIRFGSIRIRSPGTFQNAQRDECIQEIASAARMKAELFGECFEVRRFAGKLREDSHLDRAEKRP